MVMSQRLGDFLETLSHPTVTARLAPAREDSRSCSYRQDRAET